MQSLYTLGVRQTTAIQADLERLRGGDHSVSLLGIYLVSPHHPVNIQGSELPRQARYRLRWPLLIAL